MFHARFRTALITGTFFGLTFMMGSPVARADVTVERRIRTSGFAGLGPGETVSVEKISGLKKRETATVKIGGNTGKLPGDLVTDKITDVQQGLVWRLDHEAQRYTESKLKPPATKGGVAGSEAAARAEKSRVRMLRNEITVKKTGENKRISGYECAQYLVTWVVESVDVDTKKHTESTWISELWNTPEVAEIIALQQEEQAYTAAWLKKIGWQPANPDVERLGFGAVAGMLLGSDDSVKKSAQEAGAKVHGYTIASNTKLNRKSSDGAKVEQAEGGEEMVYESYSETERISTAALPAGDFAAPDHYVKNFR